VITEPRFKRALISVLILAALLRIGFLLAGDVMPVMFDARRYAAAALGVISYIDRSVKPVADDDDADRANLQYYVDKYLQGERIYWPPYKPHTLTEAREDIMVGGPLYPSILAALFVITPTGDLTAARMLGILFDLGALLCLVLVARRLVGDLPALLAGLLYAIYFPFLQTSTMLLLETSTSFLLLLALYLLLRARESDSRRLLFLAGSVAALLILNKPTAMFLGVPLALGLLVNRPGHWTRADLLRRLAIFGSPLAMVLAAWLTVGMITYGQATLRDPTYQEAGLRSSSSITFEGYDLDIVSTNFWTRGIYSDLLSQPIPFFGLFIKKFDRLWGRPYNDFRKTFLLPYAVDEALHLILIVAGLAGLILLTQTNLNGAAWPVLIIGYYSAIHVVYHSVSRYSFNALPFVLIAAAYLLVTLGRTFMDHEAARRKLTLALLLVVVAWAIDYRWIEQVGLTTLGTATVALVICLKGLLLAAGLAIVSRSLLPNRSFLHQLLMPIICSGLLLTIMSSRALARDDWAEFSCRLTSPEQRVGTRLFVSRFHEVGEKDPLGIVIDITSLRGDSGSYVLRVGGMEQELVVAERPRVEECYIKATYREVMSLADLRRNEIRQYAFLPVKRSMLSEQIERMGYLDISLSLSDLSDRPNEVTVYGTRDARPDAFIPSLRYTSLERWVVADDPRLRLRADFVSDSAVSYYIDPSGKTAGQQDLSNLPGLQSGRYHLLLMHFRSDSSLVVY